MTQKKDNFIMLPKVDICFKGLMNNPKVRKGFIAALLQKDPETIRETELLPTVLRQDYPDENLKKCVHVSILDFTLFEDDECYRCITFCDRKTGKVYTDLLEIQIMELGKIPKELERETDIIRWMRFLNGKNRKEFEDMAKTDEYLDEACRELEQTSRRSWNMKPGSGPSGIITLR